MNTWMSVRDMTAFEYAVKRVRKNMQEKPTVKQAQDNLRKCGILDSNNQVVSAYKDIVVEAKAKAARKWYD